MTAPGFLIIGAAKSGTTSLRSYLQQHPEIFVPRRGEPSFFAHEGERLECKGPGDEEWNDAFVTDWDEYQRLFESADPGAKAVGEISPRYLYFDKSSERIKHYIPNVKLVTILRNPVDRAYSHFLMNRQRGCEPVKDFQRAVEMEGDRAEMGWGWDWNYVSAGLYHHQLSRYFEIFDSDRIQVFLYEDWKKNPAKFFADLFRFIGVDDRFQPDTTRKRREAAVTRSSVLDAALKNSNMLSAFTSRVMPDQWKAEAKARIRSWNRTTPEMIPDAVRRDIFQNHFRKDAERLESLIGMDLSSWSRYQ